MGFWNPTLNGVVVFELRRSAQLLSPPIGPRPPAPSFRMASLTRHNAILRNCLLGFLNFKLSDKNEYFFFFFFLFPRYRREAETVMRTGQRSSSSTALAAPREYHHNVDSNLAMDFE